MHSLAGIFNKRQFVLLIPLVAGLAGVGTIYNTFDKSAEDNAQMRKVLSSISIGSERDTAISALVQIADEHRMCGPITTEGITDIFVFGKSNEFGILLVSRPTVGKLLVVSVSTLVDAMMSLRKGC